MQTSLTHKQAASIQTETGVESVDAATLVDEFFTDSQEKKVRYYNGFTNYTSNLVSIHGMMMMSEPSIIFF